MTDRRRLQAIMFTDIEGFSAMMSADEATTVRVVREHREIVRAALVEHGGREVRTIGDAFLVLFDSALDACSCAIATQERLLARNQGLAPAEQVWIRVGLHVGEVLFGSDGELYGEAVNIAARCEPLAARGGICLTDAVFAQVRSRVPRPIQRLGVVELKNIPNPPCLYHLAIAPTATAPARRRPGGRVVAVAGVAILALGLVSAWWAWPRPDRVSQSPAAQAAWDAAWHTIVRADLARIQLAADDAYALDPHSPEIAMLHAVTRPDDTQTTAELRHLADQVAPGPYRDLAGILVRNRTSPDDPEVAKALDAWMEAHPDDAFGGSIAVLEYPMHGATGQVHVAGAHDHARTTVLGRYVERHPDHLFVAFRWIEGLRGDGRTTEARAAAEDLAARFPRNAGVQAALGGQALLDGDLDEAEAAMRAAIELDPTMPGLREGLVELAYRRGQDEEYQRRLDALLADDGFGRLQAGFALTHAHQLVNEGRVRAGADLADRVVARLPDDPLLRVEALGFLGRACTQQQVTRCREVMLEEMRTQMIAPELPPELRDQLTVELLGYESSLAFDQGDAARVQEVADRLARLPPDRFVRVSRETALRDASTRADALNGRIDQALAAVHDKLVGCLQPFVEGNLLRAAGRLVEAEARYQTAVDTPDCGLTEVTVGARVWLARWAAERGDAAAARAHIGAARERYQRAEPDAPFAMSLTEIEAGLPR